jgi:hypothetical protein
MKWILAAALALAMTGAAHAETIRLPSNFPRSAVRDYCAAFVDSFESMTFAASGLNSGAGPVEWRCVQSAVYVCPAGADGSTARGEAEAGPRFHRWSMNVGATDRCR